MFDYHRFDTTGETPDPFEYMDDEDRRVGTEPVYRRDADGEFRVDWRNAPEPEPGAPF